MKKKALGIVVLCSLLIGTISLGGCSGSGSTDSKQNSTGASTVSATSQSTDNSEEASQDESSAESQDESGAESEKPSEVSIEPVEKELKELPPISIDGVTYTTMSKFENFTDNGWISYGYVDKIIEGLKNGDYSSETIQFGKPQYLVLKDDGSGEYDWQAPGNVLISVSYDLLKGSESSVYSSYDEGLITDIFVHARNISDGSLVSNYPPVTVDGVGLGSSKEDLINTFGSKFYDGGDRYSYTFENSDELVFHFSNDEKVNAIGYKCKAQFKAAQEEFRTTH